MTRIEKRLQRKATRRRVVRYSLLAANLALLAAVISFVAISSHGSGHVDAYSAATGQTAVNPVDHLTSFDIAANVAQAANLPEKTAVVNQAQSVQAVSAISASDSSIIAKPQVVATALKSRKDIQSYVVKGGDTVSSIATKFGVTSDSIRWSNGLGGDSVNAGTNITIPPVNGLVYTVKAGDTPQTLATRYQASVDQIVAYNDAELGGLKVGEQIIVPGGQQQATGGGRTLSFGGGFGFTPIYGSNGYYPGWCTWYVASVLPIPANWGNANTWALLAPYSGWTVSKTPKVGAIVQTRAGNHVGYVNQVSPDGSQIIYSDMNGLAGFGVVGHSGWVSASNGFDGGYYKDVVYIYR
ncbi:MAG: LysM peptidoglycan-binding domain-containing protein [Candidatus Saccharimonadales bacterium]